MKEKETSDHNHGKAKRFVISKKSRTALNAYLFIIPAVIIITTFVVIPLIYAIGKSFYNWSFYQESTFVGLKYYKRVLSDKRFFLSIWNAIRFVLIILPSQVVLGFIFALIIKRLNGFWASFVKTSIYIPNVISGIIVSLMFGFIYAYDGGILNAILEAIGLNKVAWLVDGSVVTFSIAIPAIWISLGFLTILMLAGLNDIPEQYYEAASIEGAGPIIKTFRITIPLMKNLFAYIIVTGFVATMQLFELPFIMTGGGPLGKTLTPILNIYGHFINDVDLGYAISASLLMFVLLGAITALIFRIVCSEKLMD